MTFAMKLSPTHAMAYFVACLSFSSLALAAGAEFEFKYLRRAIAASTILTTFNKVSKYAIPPEWNQQISRFAPVDGSCSAEESTKLAAMSKNDARRFVDEHSVLGYFTVRGGVGSSGSKPLEVVLWSTMDFDQNLKEGQTLKLTSLAKTPIPVRIADGNVFVGGFKVDRENSINTEEGAVVAIDGCEALN